MFASTSGSSTRRNTFPNTSKEGMFMKERLFNLLLVGFTLACAIIALTGGFRFEEPKPVTFDEADQLTTTEMSNLPSALELASLDDSYTFGLVHGAVVLAVCAVLAVSFTAIDYRRQKSSVT